MAARRRGHRRRLLLAHRYLGVAMAAFVVMLAVTGGMLNHSEGLSLDSRYVRAPALLDWYGIRQPTVAASFKIHDQWVTQFGERVYLNQRALPQSEGLTLRGAQRIGDILAVAGSDELLLYTTDGELIERMGAVHGLPLPIVNTGMAQQRLALRTDKGAFVGDADFVAWQPVDSIESRHWQQPEAIPAQLADSLLQNYQGEGLPLERVVQDIHSGRILGAWGVYFMDAVALAFVVLAGVGMWMWAVRARQPR